MGKTTTQVGLLRGINLGANNRMSMKDLVPIFEAAGATKVATYIQSGNVVYQVSPSKAAQVGAAVTAAIAKKFGFKVPVVTRAGDVLIEVSQSHPFLKDVPDTKQIHVGFLSVAADPEKVKLLDPNRSPPDRFEVRGGEVFFHTPNGGAKTKLTAPWFDSKLGSVLTVRNWNTVLQLVEMVKAAEK